MEFREALVTRRSEYSLSANVRMKEKDILSVIESCVIHAPSAFDSKSQRTVVLFDDAHKKFWSIVLEELKKRVKPEAFAQTEKKITSFAAAYGTVLFFTNDAVTEELQTKFPTYASSFPTWGEHASAMLQYMVWTSLESIGLGANLQHYNPIIDEEVKKTFDIPSSWRLIAQMPFGAIEEPAPSKDLTGRELNLLVRR